MPARLPPHKGGRRRSIGKIVRCREIGMESGDSSAEACGFPATGEKILHLPGLERGRGFA
jgi:hypothetical protein